MIGLDLRRLAAVDMHGQHGSRLRRTVIVAEFAIGALAGTALGVLTILFAPGLGWKLFGAWILGTCLNYVPLTLHALWLLGPSRLDTELAGVDIRAELRHYTRAQFWIAVPLLFVVLAPIQLHARRAR